MSGWMLAKMSISDPKNQVWGIPICRGQNEKKENNNFRNVN